MLGIVTRKVFAGLLVVLYAAAPQAEEYYYDFSRQIHFAPYAWYDKTTNSADGYFFMVAQAVANELGFSVKSNDLNLRPADMPVVAMRRLEEGKSDFYLKTYEPPLTLGAITVIKPSVFEYKTHIFIARDSELRLDSWSELEGLKGGVFATTVGSGSPEFNRYAQQHLDLSIYPSFRLLATALVNGEVDYIIAINSAIRLELYLLGQHEEFITAGPALATIPIDWLISSKSAMAKRSKQIAEVLERFKASGRLQFIRTHAMKKYFSYYHNVHTKEQVSP